MSLRTEIYRTRLYARVELYEGARRVLLTTMGRDVQRSDPRIETLARRYHHQPVSRLEELLL